MSGIVLKNGGTLNNASTISGTAYGVEIYGGTGTVINSGIITASYSGGYGVLLENGGSVTNNFGGYIGGNTAVALLDGGSVSNAFGATIESNFQSGNAVAVSVLGATGTISNSGLIVANSSSSTFAAVFLGSGGSVDNTVTGQITAGANESAITIRGGASQVTNAGTISAGVYAISLAAGGIVTNTGSIYGCVAISGGGGTVTNSGSIFDAAAANGASSGIGVSVRGGATVVNQAGGSIGAGGPNGYGVYLYGGGSIVNAGTIYGQGGAIKFAGAGVSTLTLQTGSVLSGAVIGSTAQGAINALVLLGSGTANNTFLNFNALNVKATGTWRLGGVTTIDATTVSTGRLAITGKLMTALNESTPSVVAIGLGGKLKLYGPSTLSGMTVGPGSLVVAAGTTTLVGGAGFDVGHWTVLGSTARMILDEALIYNGVFSAGSGAIVTISSGPLLLTGTVNFSGAKMTGTQRVKLSGATSASNLAIGGTGGFTNKGVLTESGVVKLGDGLGNTTQIYNAAPATWDIVNDVGITLGASPNSSILSLGLFEKTAGAGVSVIAPTFANSGHVMVSSGTLDFQNVVSGAGADTIAGAATLEFDSAVLNGQTISFVGSGGVLDLGLPTSFGGAIQGFDTVGSNDALALLGSWSIVGYAQNGSSQGVLTLYNGAQATALTFDGNYTQAQFAATTGSGHTTITIT